MTHSAWKEARSVLCVRLDSLGDVLMCTPAMRAIRQSRPGRMLTLLTSASGAAVAPFIPEVDAIISHAAPWMKHSSLQPPDSGRALAELLVTRSFDAAVIFTSYSQSPLPAAMLCHSAGIALTLAHCRENPYRLLSDWVPDPEPDTLVRHEVRRQLDLVASVGYKTEQAHLSFALRETDLASVRQLLAARGIGPHEPFILMHPGATAASRRYPAPRWRDVIRGVMDRTGFPVVVTGDQSEASLIGDICVGAGGAGDGGAGVHALAGMLSLGQLGAAIKLATVVVSNNTGPAHMAAALGTPLADLYALTNPQHTPWQVESRLLFHDVPCRFCYKSVCPQGHQDCLAKVAPARVVEAVCSLMAVSLQA